MRIYVFLCDVVKLEEGKIRITRKEGRKEKEEEVEEEECKKDL